MTTYTLQGISLDYGVQPTTVLGTATLTVVASDDYDLSYIYEFPVHTDVAISDSTGTLFQETFGGPPPANRIPFYRIEQISWTDSGGANRTAVVLTIQYEEHWELYQNNYFVLDGDALPVLATGADYDTFILGLTITRVTSGPYAPGAVIDLSDVQGIVVAENDIITGALGDDIIDAGTGHDTVYGEAGDDRLTGGDGLDRLYGSSGNDRLYGDAGNDRLIAGSGNDLVFGGADNDRIYGGRGIDVLRGATGDDRIYGGDDNDRLYGGTGQDFLYGEDGDDKIYGESGGDKIRGGLGDDRIFGDDGNDKIYGDEGQDRIWGGDGNDKLYGNAGNDIIDAGKGHDLVKGGAGNDIMQGGTGRDTFVFNNNVGDDTITDFKSTIDIIQLVGTGLAFDDLMISYTAGDALIEFGTGSILVENIAHGQLVAADFDFI